MATAHATVIARAYGRGEARARHEDWLTASARRPRLECSAQPARHAIQIGRREHAAAVRLLDVHRVVGTGEHFDRDAMIRVTGQRRPDRADTRGVAVV